MDKGGTVTPTAIDFSKVQRKHQVLAALAASLGPLSMGLNVGWSSAVQYQLSPDLSLNKETAELVVLDQEQWTWACSLLVLGALAGALCAGPIVDRIGRKMGLLLSSIPVVIGWILIVAAQNPAMIYIGRVLNGIAGGFCSVVTPTYIVEISTPGIRGRLGVLYQMSFVSGIWLVTAAGAVLYQRSREDWRWISIMCLVFPLIFAVAMFLVPESPYWLLKKGRKAEAMKALRKCRGYDYDIAPEIQRLESSVKAQDAMSGHLKDLIVFGNMKPFLVVLCLMILQQMSGTSVIVFYMTQIFTDSGSDLSPLNSALVCNSIKVLVTIFAIILVDNAGRRVLMLGSTALTTLGMAGLGLYSYMDDINQPHAQSFFHWLPMTSMIVFIIGFGFGLGPLPWLMTSEILPRKIKGPAVSIATFFNWGFGFLLTKTFDDMNDTMTDAGTFWLFAAFCFVGVIFTAFFLPETKGKTYCEIQDFFGNHEAKHDPNLNKL